MQPATSTVSTRRKAGQAARSVPAAEMWLGKPLILINTATWWHALRANGIENHMEGFGRLLSGF
ncbi:hypothetical protein [Pararoseomonas indoligenes]|uniref:Uncharacterized protein n=1 Tax=Roseomonas indoligenes TaxID=2820811 RepID=A0A940S9V7_9PROT|nr:hypothetical protein [Pararoseomonas indoligenes]MBP0495552.1 hypothetical protein [Pararoseomonas indoligenes]